jgi:hypothetical protein
MKIAKCKMLRVWPSLCLFKFAFSNLHFEICIQRLSDHRVFRGEIS